ncbi:MAG: hypothetical protein IJ678_06415 [Kiritimatiellae bacterium]|nr:hypothetical protein [Kiritimatiellia bacterium]
MSPIFRFFLGLAVFLALLAASPFAIERALRAYDRNYDPYTVPGAVQADGAALHAGLNRRLFREVRFDATGVALGVKAEGLSRVDADRLPSTMTGTVRFYRLPGPADAVPGTAPSDAAIKEAEFTFRLEPRETEPSSGVPGLQKFDVFCDIVPDTPEGEEAMRRISAMIFPAGTAWEFDLDVEGDFPEEAHAAFTYSKALRSVIRGTFLERKPRDSAAAPRG